VNGGSKRRRLGEEKGVIFGCSTFFYLFLYTFLYGAITPSSSVFQPYTKGLSILQRKE
jgi:hypothetical protein